MAYTLIPQPTDQLSVSQGDLLNNFTAADTIFAQNHGGFVANDGKHKFLQMPEQGAAPATAVNEAGLYSAVGATSAVTELVFRRENNGVSIPFTETINGGMASNTRGWTALPSGIILQWGTITIVNGNATYTFAANANNRAFPNACYSVQLTPSGGVGLRLWTSVVSMSATQVVIQMFDANQNPTANGTAQFLAIGS